MPSNSRNFMNSKLKIWKNFQIKKKKYFNNKKICYQMKLFVRNKKLKNSNQK